LLNDWINRRDRPIQRSGYRISVSASQKDSGPPKFPDFSASGISPSLAPTALQTCTPAGIPAPTWNSGMRNLSTTAPDVLPPAITRRHTPDGIGSAAISAIACSMAYRDASQP
jgi:hypothetical protein